MGSFFCGEQPKARLFLQILLWVQGDQKNNQLICVSDRYRINKKTTIKDGVLFLKQFGQICKLKVICQGSLAADFLQLLDKQNLTNMVEGVYIYCYNRSAYQYLKSNPIVKYVETDFLNLIQCLGKQIDACQLPYTIKINNPLEMTPIKQQISYHLAAMSYEIKDPQKRNYLTGIFISANNIYMGKDKSNLLDYPKQINHSKIISLYGGSHIDRYVNKTLKSGSIKHLEKAQIVISDLYQSIKYYSTYAQRRLIQESIFYQAAYLDKDQIQMFSSYVNLDIEFLGFISAFSNQKQAKQLAKINQKNNTIVTIYIPDFFKSEQSKNIQTSYIKLSKFQVDHQKKDQVIINMKTVMRLLRLDKKQRTKHIELIYGLHQMIKYVFQFGQNFTFPNDKSLRNIIVKPCKDCKQTKHLIGTISKRIICLKYIDKQQQNKQSYFYINSGFNQFIHEKKLKCMEIKYSQQAEKKFQQNSSKQERKSCSTCQKIVKCSDCVKHFCLCELTQHNAAHLQKSLFLIEGELPRFISIPNQSQNLRFLRNYEEWNRQIKNKDDALRMSKRIMQNGYHKI